MIVGVGFHRQSVDADCDGLFRGLAACVGGRIIIVAGHALHLVSDEVLASAI